MDKKEKWWKNVVIYEVYVDKFSDTFNGLNQKLDYLKFLGVNCIHLLPFYPSPMIDDGYDITDYTGIRKELGTIDDFKKFVKNAHDKGIKIIIDFVLNHTSTQHPWFIEARSSTENKKRDFYIWDKNGTGYAQLINIFFDLKDRDWIYNEPTGDYYFSTFYPDQADLNWNNPLVFSEMMRVLDFWVNIGVDSFRLDAVAHLIKKEGTNSESLPETHALVKKIRSYLDQNYNDIMLLAEVNDSVEKIKEYFSTGDECHLAYHFPLAAQMLLALKNNNLNLIKKIIKESSGIPENCAWAIFMRHHDEISLSTLNEKEREKVIAYFDPEKKYRFIKGISMR
ncbi:MAG: alpha-amylase family glycosyl hydrolase, partial [Candidatus Parcubacteria bacterium]|nr:alpha-amylase family glycosyl hydrolase [Candidatus Parcubacteria bacterium]